MKAFEWLPDMDLNHDKQIQSLLCYRYTIGQTSDFKVKAWTPESRLLNPTSHFGFPSDLGFRISDFGAQKTQTQHPKQGRSPHPQNS